MESAVNLTCQIWFRISNSICSHTETHSPGKLLSLTSSGLFLIHHDWCCWQSNPPAEFVFTYQCSLYAHTNTHSPTKSRCFPLRCLRQLCIGNLHRVFFFCRHILKPVECKYLCVAAGLLLDSLQPRLGPINSGRRDDAGTGESRRWRGIVVGLQDWPCQFWQSGYMEFDSVRLVDSVITRAHT